MTAFSKTSAAVIGGICITVIVASASAVHIANGLFSRIDRIEAMTDKIPEITEKFDRFADGFERRVDKARQALPEVAEEAGQAGARAYGVFRRLTDRKGDGEPEESALPDK